MPLPASWRSQAPGDPRICWSLRSDAAPKLTLWIPSSLGTCCRRSPRGPLGPQGADGRSPGLMGEHDLFRLCQRFLKRSVGKRVGAVCFLGQQRDPGLSPGASLRQKPNLTALPNGGVHPAPWEPPVCCGVQPPPSQCCGLRGRQCAGPGVPSLSWEARTLAAERWVSRASLLRSPRKAPDLCSP